MTYKPCIVKAGIFWTVDPKLPRDPMPVADARLRRLAIRWCSDKNLEIYRKISA